jgi:hypothetical protein
VRLAGGFYRELTLDETPFGLHDRFTDVAAVPGSDDAWATVQSYQERGSTTARARVAHLLPDGSATVVRLPAAGAGRGAAAKIEFTGPNDGWMVTEGGWVFHYTDGSVRPRDDDPAFANVIGFRPNESVAQAIPDLPPADDSQLFAPPPPPPTTTPATKPPKVAHYKALMFEIAQPRVDRRLRLHIAFRLRRKAKVQLIATRHHRVVARSRYALMRPGRHALTLQLARDRWPDGLRFRTADVTLKHGSGGSGGGDPYATLTRR